MGNKAISAPSPQTEKEAWDAVLPAVTKLKELFDYSSVVHEMLLKLMKAMTTDDPLKSLESMQALSTQIAHVLHFVMQFDDLKVMELLHRHGKMGNPNIQNDFSYYRRTLSKLKNGHEVTSLRLV